MLDQTWTIYQILGHTGVTSRQTIYHWMSGRGFPPPIRDTATWERTAVEAWWSEHETADRRTPRNNRK